ncbi:exosome component 10 [Pristis pectinata]|uniref:exosome component 10 n=1 Tax=Pristis pectinata TaxID=685728 RepID=UPI00223DF86E|nr:exosome component 10 [Pristis pectinata]
MAAQRGEAAGPRGSGGESGPGPGPGPIPGGVDQLVKHVLGTVVAATKASNGLPQFGDEFDFYRSFPGFQSFCDMQADRLLSCMSQLMQFHNCRSQIRGHNKVTELEDKFDLLVDANDVILERVGILLDEASGVNKNQQPVLPAGLQPPKTIVSSWNRRNTESKRSKSETFRLFHAKNIPRPQMKFKEKVDNSNTPFVPKLFIKPNALKPLPEVLSNRRSRLERPEDLDVPAALADFIHQQRTQQNEQTISLHPYQYELNHFEPAETVLVKQEPQMYKALSETNLQLIKTFDELVEVNEKLLKCKEIAVDLEHHSYRSFLGLTCLMQISTREEDFVIDTLELRSEMYILNEVFTDPSIVKVFHGADSDIEWLQRDFGLYVVNMFDTHQAARTLNLGRHSLDYLLKYYCDVQADKRYQLADWRLRPLPDEMLRYAQEDTHYLLYIYDKMKNQLWEQGNERANLIQLVWQKSKDICLKKYCKPIFTEESYLELHRKQKRHLNIQQLTALRLLYAWRDRIARLEDESTGYVLPNHMLIKIAEELPKEPQGIVACCNPTPPLVRQQINELHLLAQQARDMPLLKTESTPLPQKTGPLVKADNAENPLFGPHDSSHLSDEVQVIHGSVPLMQTSKLFPDLEDNETLSLCTTKPIITIFDDCVPNKKDCETCTGAQKKAKAILESFENPFRMYLPCKDSNAYISQAAKFDPSTKIYEVSNRWKLLSQECLQKEFKQQEKTKKVKETPKPAVERQQVQQDYVSAVQEIPSVRQQAAMTAGQQMPKREQPKSRPGGETAPPEKKPKLGTEKPKTPKNYKPFDYSKSDFKVFAAGSKSKETTQFDPNLQADAPQTKKTGKKNRQSAGSKSMSFTSKSERGFRHSRPAR